MARKLHRNGNSPDDFTRLVSSIYDSIYAPDTRTIDQIEAAKRARWRARKPTKDQTPEERRECWRQDAADARAVRRALGLPAKGKLTPEQKRRLQAERERQTTLAKIEREATPEHQERTRAKHREQQKRWAKANPDKIAEYQRRWKAKNPGYHRQADRDRYAVKKEANAKSRPEG